MASDDLDFEDWVEYGIAHGFCAPGVCAMHDGVPMTSDEEDEMEDGGDPCLPVLRCFPGGDMPEGLKVPPHAFGLK